MPDLSNAIVEKIQATAKRYVAEKHPLWILLDDLPRVGGSAAVFKLQKDTEFRALKIFSPDLFVGDHAGSTNRRLDLQRKLIGQDCTSLAKVYAIEEAEDTSVCLMEFVPWNELKKELHAIPAENIQLLVDQLVQAVKHLLALSLIHRDIKPENILISPDYLNLKLVDFGVVREISASEDRLDATDHGKQRPFLATAQYSPPEYLFRTVEPSDELWNALNIYQVGAVVHDLIMQRPLFSDDYASGNRYRLALAVLKSAPVLSEPQRSRHSRLASLAEACLVKNPTLRLDLVSLDSFAEPITQSSVDRLRGLLDRLTHTNDYESRRHERQQRITAQALSRLDAIATSVFDTLNGAFSTGLVLGWASGEEISNTKVIVVGLPNDTINYHFTLEIEIAEEETTELTLFLSNNKEASSRIACGFIDLNNPEVSPENVNRIVDAISDTIAEALTQQPA